jgi:YbbR domain-containing protein
LLAKELELVSLDLDPRTVTVRGPRSELKQIRSVETEPLDLRDIKGSESVTLQLRKPGAMSSISLESVTVKVEVQRKPVERQFPGRPIELRTSLDRKWLKFNPEVVQVTVVGQEDEISEVDPREILPFITLNSLPERSGEPIEVQVDVPM